MLKATQAHDLILVTQPDSPTRLGNSVARDTAPDPSFVSDERGVTWTNLDETLGSDHYILSISIQTAKIRQPTGTARLTDWRKFRECQTDVQDLNTIKDWTTYLREAADQATKRIQTTPKNPAIDNHLLHLWEARRSLTKRWKKQRHNRKLRERIAQLTEAANAYSQELCTANWRSLCDSLRGNLSTKKTWALLRNMLTPANTRRETTLALRRILNHYTGSDADLLRELQETYLGERPTRTTMTTYMGPANPALDEPISLAEVYTAAQSFKKNTAPGPDRITNAMIRNLASETLEQLTKFFNDTIWKTGGSIPPEWKEAEIILIPKPGKPIAPESTTNIVNLLPG